MNTHTPGPTTQAQLREAMARRLLRRSVSTGEISLPAAPGMIDDYVTMCEDLFAATGSPFTPEQKDHLRVVLQGQLDRAFAVSPRSNIVITFNSPVGTGLNYNVNGQWWTVEGAYENWISTRQPPLFGNHPDARIVALAGEAADPTTHHVLDIGAGTGRNALALARRGHPVDVVELTPKFADMIRAEAEAQILDVRVIQRDVFETLDDLRQDYQMTLLSEVVSDFRSAQHVRALFHLAAHCLAPGGRLVFNTFLAKPGHTPDRAERELGQQMYTSIFTWDEINAAVAGYPLELVSNDSVYDYEKANLPSDAWPPTSWYVDWTTGRDVFDVPREECPIEMRWLVYRKNV
ncbi:methyltransferase type 12 [Mycobacterium sp. 852013-51886_SCH5428379]|uniref:class I SAM-dependent methyltransferase n=1 Tax=Mycobacterium sp. 852013-51886_SCH5428379 TaxID=1834111 RepID=UPI000801F156|nr:class I SAM-dependent methyltransferase [Mycobacterium sp. 852013-51886_SCH5428379]OBB57982.1 methyltransferase type 12 [Mycobacterium sp. 852013-51886_SCH5428379]